MGLDLISLNADPTFTILVIDDSDSLRAQLITDIRSFKFNGEILEAETVTQALHTLQNKNFNLVICDRNLPDGTGIDFLLALRKHSEHSKVPYIMCTSVSQISLVTSAIAQGANEYIFKPWSKTELLKKILTVTAKANKS
jgi:DNA-binding response OmpR family regulator